MNHITRRVLLILFLLSPIEILSSARAQPVPDSLGLYPPANIDERATVAINHWGYTNPGLDNLFVTLSRSMIYTAVGGPIVVYGYGLLARDPAVARVGLLSGLSVGVASLLTEGIKQIARKPRPFLVLQDIRLPDGPAPGYARPSGHSAASFALATSLAYQFPKWYVIIPAYLYAGGVALSRPYLGVHYLSDILLGGAIGFVTGWLVVHYRDEILKRLGWALPGSASTGSTDRIITHWQPQHFEFSLSW